MKEIDYIEEAKSGDKNALNTLIINNYPLLKGYSIKLTGNVDDAGDLVNDTVVKIILNIHKYKTTGSFSSWMLTVATNIYRDKLRKMKREEIRDDIDMVSTSSIEENVINKLKIEQVLKLLQEIPYEKRSVFILKHYYNYKYEEISQILGCPVGTVRSRLHYTVKYLLKHLEENN